MALLGGFISSSRKPNMMAYKRIPYQLMVRIFFTWQVIMDWMSSGNFFDLNPLDYLVKNLRNEKKKKG